MFELGQRVFLFETKIDRRLAEEALDDVIDSGVAVKLRKRKRRKRRKSRG